MTGNMREHGIKILLISFPSSDNSGDIGVPIRRARKTAMETPMRLAMPFEKTIEFLRRISLNFVIMIFPYISY